MGTVDFKRNPATITQIQPILKGTYVHGSDEANHVLAGSRKLYRVNIIAAVVDVDGMNATVDDGDRIQLRSFEEEFDTIAVGDVIMVIGKPREYNGQKYVVPEIIKKVTPEWLQLRKLQLEKEPAPQPQQQEEAMPAPAEEEVNIGSYDKITAAIRNLDQGQGADTEAVIKESGTDAESSINRLLQEGEIFEVKPGKLKVLE